MEKEFKGFYFDSTVLFLDDNESFMTNLSIKLSDNYRIETYTDPHQALEKIIENHQSIPLPTLSNSLVNMSESDLELAYEFDFSFIKQLAQEKNKNELITVIVVDYSMPLINGLDFCKKISHLPAMKIMLTGHADFQIAIDAFNNGYIDKFLVKDTPDMVNEINSSILAMQSKFFQKISYPISSFISAQHSTFITQNSYMKTFEKIIQELGIKEFYLIDSIGSYLLITNTQEHYYLMVLSNNQLEEYIEIISEQDSDQQLIAKMLAQTHAPIFINEIEYKLPVTKWDLIVEPIYSLDGYYYSLIRKEQRELSMTFTA